MREIVFLHTGTSDRVGHLDHDAVRACVEPLDMYDLPQTDLSAYRAMIVTGGVDQELLWRERDAIRRFLDGFLPWVVEELLEDGARRVRP